MSAEQVRPGYQLTEVGVIPEDWGVVELGDMAEKVGSGITPTGGSRVYRSHGRPFIRSQNVGWGELLLDDIVFIDEATHATFPSTEIKAKDVLLNITGASIGRSAVADQQIEGGNVNQHVCIIRLDPEELEPRFLNAVLLSEHGQRQIESFQAGGNRQGLNFGQIRSFRIPLPPLPEQRAIAAALGDVDALLAGLERLIAKRRAVKQAAMDALLSGRVRLPGFGQGAGRRQSEVGVIPEDWEVKKIGDVLQLQYGKSQKGITTDDGLYPILATSGQVGRTNSFLYDKPSIIIGRKGTIDAPQYVECPFWPIDTTFYCMLSENVFPKFLYYLLSTVPWQSYNEASGVPSLNADTVHAIKIALPSLAEQRAIAAVLSDMDAAIAALARQRDKVQALKQGMMAELLTGRVRLVESPPARYNDDRSTGEEKQP